MNHLIRKKLLLLFLFFVQINFCTAQDFILKGLKDELEYQTEKYKDDRNKPYFMQFNVFEMKAYHIKSSFGSIISSEYNQIRYFSPEVRIGNFKLDNTHINESDPFGIGYFPGHPPKLLTIEDSLFQISRSIRKSMDEAHKGALEKYKQNKKESHEQSAISTRYDFSEEKPNVYYENPATLNFDKDGWENTLKAFTDPFTKLEYIKSADAELMYSYSRNYVLNTEGSSVVQNRQNAQVIITLLVKCSDNTIAPIIKTFCANTPEGFPNAEEFRNQANELNKLAIQLKEAPSAEAYTGPCILSASASGVFFHEIFGHRIEGHRLNSMNDAQTFKNKIGDFVLPEFLSISFDPTAEKFGDTDLFGYYKFDDQAVKSRKIDVVKNGKLLNFLMCRTPVDSSSGSNGHGRCSFGAPVVSRQSNMFVSSSQTYTESQLKDQLIKICKKKKKEYGLYFKEVTGGFTNTSIFSPNVFNVIPTIVYKIYVDGRPDELVKGVSLIGTPLTMFSEITHVGNESSVFNGYCTAESGAIPVSTICPSLLVTKIETQKMFEVKNDNTQISKPDIIK